MKQVAKYTLVSWLVTFIDSSKYTPFSTWNFHKETKTYQKVFPLAPSTNNSDAESNPGLRTVIKIGTNSQSIEHHHHHIHHLGNGACVDTTPFMTPAQSVENFYQNQDDQDLELLDDEALSVAGTEYSEAPSVARSYTISHSAQVKCHWIWGGEICKRTPNSYVCTEV